MEVKEGYKQTEVGVIPEDWRVVPLGEKADKIGSGITPTGGVKVYKNEGRTFLRSQNVGWGTLVLDDVAFIDNKTHETFAATEIKKNDVFLNITGASIGRSAIADERVEHGNVNQHVCIIRTNAKELNPKYLNYFLLSTLGQKQIDSFQAGGNRQGLNFGQIKSFNVILPSKAEQTAIAKALSDTDALIQSLEKLIAKKRSLKQGTMQLLLTGKKRLPGFSGAWSFEKVGDIATVIRGASPRPKGDTKYYGGNIPRLMVEDVTRDGKYVTPKVDFLTNEGAKRSRLCKAGTLTIVCSGTVGIPSFLAVDACIHDGFLALMNIDRKISADYIFHQLIILKEKLDNSATHGGVFTNLTTSSIKEFEISFPTFEEQTAIAKVLSDMDNDISSLENKLHKYKAIKQGMMQNLLTGKIRLA